MDEKANPPSIEHAQGLLPAFSARQYSHLPTPQSPNTLGRYVHDRAYSPESPVPNGVASTSSTSQIRGSGSREIDLEGSSGRPQSALHQCITPASSPHFSSNILLDPTGSATPPFFIPSSSHDFATPKQSSAKADPAEPRSHPAVPRTSKSPTPPSAPSKPPVTLSSPFMAKPSIPSVSTEPHPTSSHVGQVAVDHTFISSRPGEQSAGAISSMSTPPISPYNPPNVSHVPVAGGEMERIRQAIAEDKMAFVREAERRRPEYLKRSKRVISETDPSNFLVEDESEKSVGIMESPQKGRRLKLFQETSEESFEESLMAGGYGRYRTADWVRQPQPIAFPSSVVAGSSTIVSLLEEAEEAPPSEKELKKRRRLAAFRDSSQQNNAKLSAVELEGRGRVLMEVPSEEVPAPASPEPTPSKKRAQNRRKKKSNEAVPSKKALGLSEVVDDLMERPNWPDTEFPWRIRTEERLELAKAEEEERMRWIEKFLDRDSDDEDEVEFVPVPKEPVPDPYEYVPGRGKTMPLLDHAGLAREGRTRKVYLPNAPADARLALLSKRSVRAFVYRQRKRQRELDDEEDDEIVCICHGRDDGRELVQCDACQTWYHLQCIGINNIAELGREEDPWFCRRCVVRSPSPSREPQPVLTSEPIFVLSEEPEMHRYSDAPFYQPGLQDSPHWPSSSRVPRTPTTGHHTYASSDSHSSWAESSRAGPSTPKHTAPPIRTYSSPYDGYFEESPFDPTSTPSRGIKFHPPFTTPKTNSWAPRGSAGLFQTPSRPSMRRTAKASSGTFTLTSPDDVMLPSMPPHEFLNRPYDESPIRRSSNNALPRRSLHSPPRTRPLGQSHSILEESPVVRSIGSEMQK